MDNCRRLREFRRAKRLWEIMVQFNVRISRIFYPSLMAMAAKNGDIDVAVGIAFYVLGTGFLRRAAVRSEDPFLRVLAHAIIYVKHAIDAGKDRQLRNTRQTRMAVLYESSAITKEEMASVDPETAFKVCVTWGDDHSRQNPAHRRNEKSIPERVKHVRRRLRSARLSADSVEPPG